MDSSEYTRIVHGRIQRLEPELASKIVGYLLLLDNGDQRMMQLASGPDNLIRSIINKVKNELFLLLPPKLPAFQSSSFVSSPRLAHLQVPPPLFPAATGLPPSGNASSHQCTRFPTANHQPGQSVELPPSIYMDQVAQDHCLHNQMPFYNCFDSQKVPISSSGYDYLDPAFNGSASSRASPRLSGGGFDFPVKVCHYFRKGFCKHGSSCRYFHGNPNGNFLNDDQAGSPQSLEKLEWELTELLKSRNGLPVSIAMLPMRYYERYGKTLQAEGYLTESQRHGKAGYSLTKLLARMKNNICLIDRAHGQHAVILAEDLPEYMERVDCHSDQGGGMSICDRQIYLTFPAESKFTEKDVSDYFSGYGPVEDVRIPNLQQRMYGFVTFVYPETVRKILAIGNPHYVCNSRVLVKPYKEKSKLSDRKISQRRLQARCMLNHVNVDSEQRHAPRMFCGPRTISKHYEEPHEPQHELERRHLEIIMNRTLPRRPPFTDSIGCSMAELKLTKKFTAADRLDFPFDDISNTRPLTEERAKCSDSSAYDPESDEGINLPDSPFGAIVANSI